MRPRIIISGGQSGSDKGGLLGARDVGIETGGCAPKGYRTENGPDPSLAEFGLEEHSSPGYEGRTKVNVVFADGTAIFGDVSSAGSRLTISLCERFECAYIKNPTPAELREWVQANQIVVLNVAGNRESVSPGIQERVRGIIVEAFGEAQ